MHPQHGPNLVQKLKKLQTTQNKCLRFCLKLDASIHIEKGHSELAS